MAWPSFANHQLPWSCLELRGKSTVPASLHMRPLPETSRLLLTSIRILCEASNQPECSLELACERLGLGLDLVQGIVNELVEDRLLIVQRESGAARLAELGIDEAFLAIPDVVMLYAIARVQRRGEMSAVLVSDAVDDACETLKLIPADGRPTAPQLVRSVRVLQKHLLCDVQNAKVEGYFGVQPVVSLTQRGAGAVWRIEPPRPEAV